MQYRTFKKFDKEVSLLGVGAMRFPAKEDGSVDFDTMTKMTYANALSYVLSPEIYLPEDVREKLTALKASVEKKNSSEKKPTAQQVANDAVKDAILSHMANEPDRMFTITELMKEVPALSEATNQRTSALVRQLMNVGKVERIEDKRKAYFRMTEGE